MDAHGTTQVERQSKLFGGSAPYDEVCAFLDAMPAPTGPESMFELAAESGLSPGKVVLDVGAYGGRHAIELAKRLGSHGVALDLVRPGLAGASEALRSSGVEGLVWRVQGDAQVLPFRDDAVDVVWSRDMISCVDPGPLFREAARVLKPRGRLVLHAVYLTDAIEGAERRRFEEALSLTEGVLRTSVEGSMSEAGLEVVRRVELGAQWREHELAQGEHRLEDDLLAVMRLERGRDELVERFGHAWYETILGWRQWAVFMALGKLEVVLYLLVKA